MSTTPWHSSGAARVAAVAAVGAAVLSGITAAGAVRERSGLPAAGHQLLLATQDASAITSCLQGARDELYVPGVAPLLHNAVAVAAARNRLGGCDIGSLSRALDAVDVPPAAPVTDRARRIARSDITTAVATLRRVVLDARGADRLMQQNLNGRPDGTAIVLAYRSASSGSDSAYELALEALALLGEPQSTVS
jgi:hypothetical protein